VYRLSEQLDSRKSGIYRWDNNDKVNDLEEDAKYIAGKELKQNDGNRAHRNPCGNRDKQWTRAAFARDGAHRFRDDDSRGGRARADDEQPEVTDSSDQRDQRGRNAREDGRNQKTNDEVIPFGGVESALPVTDTFLATISRWCADRAGGADGPIAVVAAQGSLARGVHVAE